MPKQARHQNGERRDFVAREVFAPLGMTSSGYVTGPIPRERMATGYFKEGERFVPEPPPLPPSDDAPAPPYPLTAA
jgi:CubicO group peptidase (beta-lactamase class C family)